MLRNIINIDHDKCNGCGDCIPECHEGALQLIDGKATLISDLFCDGLGACIGHCPEGAITIEEREAEPYDEVKVLQNMLHKPNVMKAHLKHLIDHDAMVFYNQAIEYLEIKGIQNPLTITEKKPQLVNIESHHSGGGCPGSKTITFDKNGDSKKNIELPVAESQLKQWPIQLHLVNPAAPYFKDSEIVIMSTCGPLASPNIHNDYLKGRSVVVACPKLDYTDPYTDKLASIFQSAGTKKAIVVIMEVPCCRGLAKFAYDAAQLSGNKNIEIEIHIMALDGSIKEKQVIFRN